MTPLLLPIAGGLAILLLLGLLLHLRRKARELAPDAETDVDPDAATADERADQRADEAFADAFDDDTDILPMLSHDERDGAARADTDPEPVESSDDWDDWDDEVHTPEPLPDAESVRLRSLRAQVRTLQEALEQQDVPGTPTDPTGEATFRRQVTAALRGLGERTREDESPERTLARVVAAIDRLDAPDEVARPVLPTVKFDLSGAQMSLAGRQYLPAPAALVRAAAPAPVPAPAVAPAPAPHAVPDQGETRGPGTVTTPLASALAAGVDSDTDHQPPTGRYSDLDPFAQDEQVLPPPPEPDVVRPVPPPTSHRDERPRRFGRRRDA